MEQIFDLPEDLAIAIGTESKDFVVWGKRAKPVGASLSRIIFGVVWLGFITFFISFFLGPGFTQNIIQSISGALDSSNANESGQSPLFLLAFFGLFIGIGLFVFFGGVFSLLKSGGYFVGTATRLIRYRKGKMMSADWEQFNGKIEVRGNNKSGSILLEMRTGTMVSGKSGSRYVPDFVYISGVQDVYEIEKICRRRIKENDPTPSDK